MDTTQLLKSASDLVPKLKSRAQLTEDLRQIPQDTIRDLLGCGIYQIGIPRSYSGNSVKYGVCLDVGVELAKGCGSAAWCYSLWTAHAFLIGHWPLVTQDEVFGGSEFPLCSSSLNPGRSEIQAVDGGYKLSGRWEFSSGCDAAGWVMLGAPKFQERTWLLLPSQDYEIVDNWFVSGLKGTGSKDIVVQDAFVPAHRILNVAHAGNKNRIGWEAHRQTRYKIPIPALLGWDLVAPIVGLAQGMIDEFILTLKGTSGPGRTADSYAVHHRLSEAQAQVDAGYILMKHDVDEMFQMAREDLEFSQLDRARYRRDKAFIAQLCLRSVNSIFELSGAHALFSSTNLQRIHRDAQAMTRRDGLIMDLGGHQYGRIALGLEADGPI